MDPILQIFLSWQFLIFGVGVCAVVFVLRKVAEYSLANWKPLMKESKLWNELLMPISPIFVGVIGALAIRSYPYPNNLTSGGSRFIFGLGAGLLSTVLYRLITAVIGQRINSIISQNPGAAIAAAATEDNAKSNNPATIPAPIPATMPVTVSVTVPAAVSNSDSVAKADDSMMADKGMSAGAINK